jgi:2-polyprenyl-3-methyl-5-hydroxy-6-metoxy-1,4-benzoquinol methylase
MFNLVKKVLPPETRHKLVRSLPKPLRHRVVDWYMAHQYNQYQRLGKKKSNEREGDFWRTVPHTHLDNTASVYAEDTNHAWEIDWGMALLKKYQPKGRLLEFGCNAGRVMHVFAEAGYECVGVDINAEAIELAKKTFPSLADAKFICGDGTTVLKQVPDNSVDAVYTMSVLRHVSPHSIETITRELARISRRYIMTFEDEGSFGPYTFPRDYKSVFESLGYRQLAQEYSVDRPIGGELVSLGNMLRIFEKLPS